MKRNYSFHYVTNGQFAAGYDEFDIAEQYWNADGALVSLFYSEPDGEPEAFAYRFEKDSSVRFYEYDMRGNYKKGPFD